jgi:hypothetical protein
MNRLNRLRLWFRSWFRFVWHGEEVTEADVAEAQETADKVIAEEVRQLRQRSYLRLVPTPPPPVCDFCGHKPQLLIQGERQIVRCDHCNFGLDRSEWERVMGIRGLARTVND